MKLGVVADEEHHITEPCPPNADSRKSQQKAGFAKIQRVSSM
jgi:hypothetical protein